ncbi:MAG: hypothetical protein ACRDVD_05005 [Acidimicrobiia bacterium]
MKRKLAAAGIAAILALSAAACDTVDDPGIDGDTLPGDTLAPDLTTMPDTVPTTLAP